MAIGLDTDGEYARRSSIPSGGAGTLSGGGFSDFFAGVWVYRASASATYANTAGGSIIHGQAGAREIALGFDSAGSNLSDLSLTVVFNSGGGTGAVQNFGAHTGADFLDEWVYYFFYENSANSQVAGYILLSDLATAVTITRANDNAGSQYVNDLTFGSDSGAAAVTCGHYAFARAVNDAGLTASDVLAYAASDATETGDWGFWELGSNTDTADTSGNGRTLTFSSGLTSETSPTLGGGGGGLNLDPSLYTNTQTFHAPTVTTGAVSLAPALFTNTQTFPAATVSAGASTVAPPRLTNAQTFHAPTVSVGAATVAPGLLTNSQTFPAPTVSTGAVSVAPGLLTNGQTFYGPTVTQGGVSLAPPLLTNAADIFAPALSVGAVSLQPALVTNTATFYGPIVSGGTLLEPPLLTNAQTFQAPTISVGGVSVAPPLVDSTPVLYAPTVAGAQTIAAPLLTNTQTFFAASVGEASEPIVIPQHSFAEFSGAVVKTKQAPRAPRIRAPKRSKAVEAMQTPAAQTLTASTLANEIEVFSPRLLFTQAGLIRTAPKPTIQRASTEERLAYLERELTTLRRALSSTRGR